MTEQTFTHAGVQQWGVDGSHSEVSFTVRHLMIATVRGGFNSFSATATFNPEEIENGSVQVEIDAASIDTRDERRDEHLCSADFLDAANFPALRFESSSIEARGGSAYDVHGELTVRDVTRPVTLQAEFTEVISDPFGGTRIAVNATTEIDRTEFGLTWNQALETGGVMVSDKVSIAINAQFVVNE